VLLEPGVASHRRMFQILPVVDANVLGARARKAREEVSCHLCRRGADPLALRSPVLRTAGYSEHTRRAYSKAPQRDARVRTIRAQPANGRLLWIADTQRPHIDIDADHAQAQRLLDSELHRRHDAVRDLSNTQAVLQHYTHINGDVIVGELHHDSPAVV